MDYMVLNNILLKNLKYDCDINTNIYGDSMSPTISPADNITIRNTHYYCVGDIVAFFYKNNSVLVHRIIKKDNKYYYCKGDNSFRLENVEPQYIIGKVILINNKLIHPWEPWKINLSYKMHTIFREYKYNAILIKESILYKFYYNLLVTTNLGDEKKNTNSLSFKLVFNYDNPISPNYFYGIEKQIIEILYNPCTINQLMQNLGINLKTDNAKIAPVVDFLYLTISNGIVSTV